MWRLEAGTIGAVVLALLAACASVEVPRAGEPIALAPGKALVFGRIRMLDAKTGSIEYGPFWFDPWDQPFFVPGPRLTLELRQLLPPGGALRYRSHPAPEIARDGTFAWILDEGDYALMGNPRLLGSESFSPYETFTLATFAAPAAGSAYVGTLVIDVSFGLVDMVRAERHDEAEYVIEHVRVADEREAALAQLRNRHRAIPEPVVGPLMRVE